MLTQARSPQAETDVRLADQWTFSELAQVTRTGLQRLLLFPLLDLVAPIAVRNASRLEAVDGPVIVAANHVSHLDTPVILKALPETIRRRLLVAAAKDYFYRSRVGGAVVSFALGTIPFDRGEGSRHSLRRCERLLRGGWSLLVFPEGTRSTDGRLGRVRSGVAVLSCRTGRPILPLHLHGLSQVMPKGSRAPRPGPVVVEVGDPIAPDGDVESTRARLARSLRRMARHAPSLECAS